MNKIGSYIVALVALPVLFSSCILQKKAGKKNKKEQAVTTTVRDTIQTVQATPDTTPTVRPDAELLTMLLPLQSKRMDYRTFSGKAKVSFQSPDKSADFSANFRLKKDSVMWVNVTALGGLYPVARMLMTRDSFFMVNHIEKEVTLLPLTDVSKVLPVSVTLPQLQHVLTGDPIVDATPMSAEQKDAMWTIHMLDATYMQQLSYRMADSTLMTCDLQPLQAGGPHALLVYAAYAMVSDRRLSTERTVDVQNGLKNYHLEMSITNPEFDKALDYPFSIPKNYTIKAH
ncbi:hypothetical protein GCM10023093_28380 [Nemorincola caseinilytica]|uniref:DUF4292 domain-containing protein n=1 Tax=Nemorincola caseinilytica TaxID=2054315 RepID=A0ABP8NLX5_9BACT